MQGGFPSGLRAKLFYLTPRLGNQTIANLAATGQLGMAACRVGLICPGSRDEEKIAFWSRGKGGGFIHLTYYEVVLFSNGLSAPAALGKLKYFFFLQLSQKSNLGLARLQSEF